MGCGAGALALVFFLTADVASAFLMNRSIDATSSALFLSLCLFVYLSLCFFVCLSLCLFFFLYFFHYSLRVALPTFLSLPLKDVNSVVLCSRMIK